MIFFQKIRKSKKLIITFFHVKMEKEVTLFDQTQILVFSFTKICLFDQIKILVNEFHTKKNENRVRNRSV